MKLYTILGSFLGLSLCMTIASCHAPQPTSEITWSTFNIRYDNPYDSLNSWTYRKRHRSQFHQGTKSGHCRHAGSPAPPT